MGRIMADTTFFMAKVSQGIDLMLGLMEKGEFPDNVNVREEVRRKITRLANDYLYTDIREVINYLIIIIHRLQTKF